MDDDIQFFYEEERKWYENILPSHIFGLFLVNVVIFLFVYSKKMNPYFYVIQIGISIIILWFIGSNKSKEDETKLRLKEALKILHNELQDRESLEKDWHIRIPKGEWESGNVSPIHNPIDNKLMGFRMGFGIRNIKGVRRHFLATISADRYEKGYGTGLVGLESIDSKFKGEAVIYKPIPVKKWEDWKDALKFEKSGFEK